MLGTPNLGSYEAVRWLTWLNPTQAKLSLLDITQSTEQIINLVPLPRPARTAALRAGRSRISPTRQLERLRAGARAHEDAQAADLQGRGHLEVPQGGRP